MTGDFKLQLVIEILLTFTVIVDLIKLITKVNHILKSSSQLDFLWELKQVISFFGIKTDNVDTLTVLWDISIVFPVENLPLDEVVVLSQGFTNDLEGIAMVMTDHVLDVFYENGARFASLNHAKQFEEKIPTIIIKALAISRNTKGLARETSHNHIHALSWNIPWLNIVNITTIQIGIWMV